MIKHLHIKTIFLSLAVLCIVCSCEETDLLEEKEAGTDTKVITINGLTDPEFMTLAAPFTSNAVAGRVLEDSDFQKVKKITGNGYVTYTVPIARLNNTPSASHSLVMSLRDDTVRYNLMEIIPDKSWNGNFEEFTGSMNTYMIKFSKDKENIAGKELNKAHVGDCYVFVIDEVIVHNDLSATAVGHWEHKNECASSGGGGSSDGGYSWVSDWGSSSSGNWSDGGTTGSGGSGTSGDNVDSEPKYEEVPISLEEAMVQLWLRNIDDSQVDPCIADIVEELTTINSSLGFLLKKIAGTNLAFNWKLQNGTAKGTAETSASYSAATKTITTTFDALKLTNASDISIARTILHESLHAWLIFWFWTEYVPSNQNPGYAPDYPGLIELWADESRNTNDVHHEFIAREFIGQITSSLKQYIISKGYNIDDGYIAALAWGGLQETEFFKTNFTSTQEENISHVINVELNGPASSQKGSSTNCN